MGDLTDLGGVGDLMDLGGVGDLGAGVGVGGFTDGGGVGVGDFTEGVGVGVFADCGAGVAGLGVATGLDICPSLGSGISSPCL